MVNSPLRIATLAETGLARRDEADVVLAPGPIDEHESAEQVEPQSEEPFLSWMRIIAREGTRILESSKRVRKVDTVLPLVLTGFVWVLIGAP